MTINPLGAIPATGVSATPTGSGVGAAAGVSGVTSQGGLAGATAAPSPPGLSPVAAPASIVSPQAALANLITGAAIAQDGLAGLFADLAAAQTAPTLPDALGASIQKVLSAQPPLDGTITGPALRTAVANSGLFLEAQLAQGLAAETAPAVAADFKAALLQLAADLGALVEAEPTALATIAEAAAQPAATTTPSQPRACAVVRPPPPLRGGVTQGQSAAPPAVDAQTPEGRLLRVLGHDVHAALARLELSQAASAKARDGSSFWKFELPVAAPDGQAVAQFEIFRDGQGHGAAGDTAGTWRTRFALNVTPSGQVHAELALSGDAVHVTLWADDADTRALLSSDRAELVAELKAEGLSDAAVRIAPGTPNPPPAPAAGALLNRST